MKAKIRHILQKNEAVWTAIRKLRTFMQYCQSVWMSTVTYRAIPSSTPLMLLAKKGNVEALETYLISHNEVNSQDCQNRTALHYAIKCRQPAIAACLLTYGADYTLPDNQDRRPLDLNFTDVHMLHTVRQRYHRFIKRDDETTSKTVCLEDLDKKGIVKISGLIDSNELKMLQNDFEAFVENLNQKVAKGEAKYTHYDDEEHWRPELNAYITNNAFKYSRQLVNLCCNAKLLDIVKRFYSRDVSISRGIAMRYLPNKHTHGIDQFQWHHDMEDKRLKVMILLTDVSNDDQYMSYAMGTHKALLPYEDYFNNSYDLEYAAKLTGEIDVFNTIGKAGDIFLFDSNGAHRGNRRPEAKTRDAFFVEFTDDANNVWGGDMPEDYFFKNSVPDLNSFKSMISVPKKWEQPLTRYYCDWVTNLPDAARWIRK